MIRRLALALLGTALAGAARAGNCDTMPVLLDDPNTPSALRLARVIGPDPRVHFVQPAQLAPGCPATTVSCAMPAFLVPGDTVVFSGATEQFACVSFTNRRGQETDGWFPVAALAVLPAPAADWTGHWTSGEASFTLSETKSGRIAVKGDATWGAGDPARVARGAVHTGQVEGETAPEGNVLAFAMGDRTLPYDAGDQDLCRIRLVLLGPWLVARDNNNCGGANVTFSGLYRRADGK